MAEIDLLANAILNASSGEAPSTDVDGPDALDTFLQNAKLAGEFGPYGWRRVERLADETKDLETRWRKIVKSERRERAEYGTAPASAAGSGWDEPITQDDAGLLIKSGADDRRRGNLRAWMRGELALGKSCRELVDHAQKHDPATARLLNEIGEELGVS